MLGVIIATAYSGFFACLWLVLAVSERLAVDGVFGIALVLLLVCISAPFGMNGVVSGAFSGSFRCGAMFSLSDA